MPRHIVPYEHKATGMSPVRSTHYPANLRPPAITRRSSPRSDLLRRRSGWRARMHRPSSLNTPGRPQMYPSRQNRDKIKVTEHFVWASGLPPHPDSRLAAFSLRVRATDLGEETI